MSKEFQILSEKRFKKIINKKKDEIFYCSLDNFRTYSNC